MFRTILTTALTTLAIGAHAAPGYMTTSLDVDHRDQSLAVHIWYPATDGTSTKLGKNAVFKGAHVLKDATPQGGAHPLVILSHGSGGNAANLSWIAGALAEQGMIVLAANHSGTTSGDSHPIHTVRIWERPADQAALIDFASNLPRGLTADMRSITSMGFSLGGYTALAHAGAQVRKADFIAYCDANPHRPDCGWFARGGVDLNIIDAPRFEQSNMDPRVTAVVAIDPALAQAYKSESLADMTQPTLLINLGENAPLPVDAKEIAPHMPNATFTEIKGATHFSFLGECTRTGWMLLKMADEDPICTETSERSRADIHAELKDVILDFLKPLRLAQQN